MIDHTTPTKLSPAAARPFRGLLDSLQDAPVTLMALGLTIDESEVIRQRIEALDDALRPHLED